MMKLTIKFHDLHTHTHTHPSHLNSPSSVPMLLDCSIFWHCSIFCWMQSLLFSFEWLNRKRFINFSAIFIIPFVRRWSVDPTNCRYVWICYMVLKNSSINRIFLFLVGIVVVVVVRQLFLSTIHWARFTDWWMMFHFSIHFDCSVWSVELALLGDGNWRLEIEDGVDVRCENGDGVEFYGFTMVLDINDKWDWRKQCGFLFVVAVLVFFFSPMFNKLFIIFFCLLFVFCLYAWLL